MNDTHMSHAMEFNFPQSMANCVACHEGKLDVVLADEFFTIKTCTSCHPVNGKGGTDGKRAPALMGDGTAASPGVMPSNVHGTMDLANTDCRMCHKPGSARTFKQIHGGRTATIYAADGTRYSDVFTTKVDSASFDKATNVLTVNFSATKTAGASITQTAADIVPTVVVSLYGYGAKDFIVGGHTNHADGTRNLEATAGGTSHARVTFSGTAPSWTATIDLSTWAAQIGSTIERAEVGILPKLLSNLADASSPALAIKGVTQTVDLVGATTLVPDKDSYGKAIVDPAKCNACHDALGTTFHNASYGSAGVVACRLCHIVGNGGSHLEMQSRSIDSYVHAIHSMQAFDVGMSKPVAQWTAAELDSHIDFNDPIAVLRHELHVEGNYPNFAGTLNCESCHNKGTYDVPNQAKSLPSILSASADYLNGSTRAISGVPSYVVGPASRACGSCHRAELINEEDAGTLAAFNQHTALNGTLALAGTTSAAAAATLDAVTQNIMAKVGGPAASLTAPAGTQIETCTICHPNAGADHQAAFNRWADGL
jgi:OmcA/MtrC family decaheme c-type cytochrome